MCAGLMRVGTGIRSCAFILHSELSSMYFAPAQPWCLRCSNFTTSARVILLKGQCHEIFDPRFFSSNNPPRALIHGLKPFRIWLRILLYETPRKPYISNNYLNILGEFEAIFETALAHESGPLGGLFDEKSRVENLVTLSL
jgi:hypothetical protein